MCASNANCDAYYFETSQCHEANASGLVGSPPHLSNSKNVYIGQILYISNKGDFNVFSPKSALMIDYTLL